MIFDVPSPQYIPSLVSAVEQSPFYSQFLGRDHVDEYNVHSIFHLCGPRVIDDDRYKMFLDKFSPEVHVSTAIPALSASSYSILTLAYCIIS